MKGKMSSFDKILTVILICAILSTLGVLGYIVSNPKTGERFTQFYILDLESKTINYPEKLAVGEEGKVLIGIINQEQKTVTYRIEIIIDDTLNSKPETITLGDGEKWERMINFIPAKVKGNQKVEFLLYKQGEIGISNRLHLWIDVRN